MRGSSISLPSLLEECEDTSLICKLAAKTYDPGQTYANTKVLVHIYLFIYFEISISSVKSTWLGLNVMIYVNIG